MSSQRLEADLDVDGFGLVLDGPVRRLDFPRGHLDGLRGTAGSLRYGVGEIATEGLQLRLDRMHWQADAGSAGAAYLRGEDDTFSLDVARLELPRGFAISRSAEGGAELLAPHATLVDVKLALPELGRLRRSRASKVAVDALRRAADVPLRQERLRVLDSLTGELHVTVNVVLDLPVLGTRTLDQVLRIPIADGSLDFRALEDSLDWLEGTFLDLGVQGDRLVLSWGVPIVMRSREIISFQLDDDARALAAFGRVPLRSLADFRLPAQEAAAAEPDGRRRRKSPLRSLRLAGLSVQLSMAAPRSVEVGHGTLQFGGDDAPGIVGLTLTGSLGNAPVPGRLAGDIGLLDVTAKDVPVGPATLTVDRLHLGAIENLEVRFEGFTPTGLSASIHRITATNLSLRLA